MSVLYDGLNMIHDIPLSPGYKPLSEVSVLYDGLNMIHDIPLSPGYEPI